MPLFLSDEEFRQCSHDGVFVADKADAYIRELINHLETVKAEADAASITAEQNCSLFEQKYVSLSAEFSSLQSQNLDLNASIEQRDSDLAKILSEKQQLLLQSIEKDGEIERLRREASELQNSKRQLVEMLEQKDLEISEKNATIKSYLDKIVNLSESAASKEARMSDIESSSTRLQATSARLLQEKELLERHNTWLNEELTAKVDSLIQLRKANGDFEADMSSKLDDVEKKFKESSASLKMYKDRVGELEAKLGSIEEELLSTKAASAAAEDSFSAEISTVTKLVDLYKESSEEWSKKAGELEGVIKALETHLNQVENEYKEKLEKGVSARKEVEKESAELKEKLQISDAELEKLRKENEQNQLPLSSFTTNSWSASIDSSEMSENDRAIVPRIAAGVSGTALAASLLRDGWSLAKIYSKYQEAVDALQHEQLGRKQTQAVLERVLYEIEEKAGLIFGEREEHQRLLEAYSALNQKLQDSISEHSALESNIQELKASLKRQERDYATAQREIVDLEKQVAVLLKECRDIQLRCGSVARDIDDDMINVPSNFESDAENIISELTFKDINRLVEQNVQLRSLVHNLSSQIEEKEAELKENYEKELHKHTVEAASKVNAVLLRAEEQGQMIESLHTSVAMYKKLYEEEHKLRSSTHPQIREAVQEQGGRELMLLRESNHETSKKAQEQAFERVKHLEEDMAKSRSDIISLRAERDKFALAAQFAEEKLTRFMKEFDHQREEHNGVLARNVEFTQVIIDYQRKLRESSESINAASQHSQKFAMEVSILKQEKEILQNAEKRATDEVHSLSERVHRLQATLDTIQSTQEAREEAQGIERRKQEEYIKKVEREWAEAKKELQEERDNARKISLEREITMRNALRQVEETSKELANSLQAVAAAESRAAAAEARCSDLEKIIESARSKESDGAGSDSYSSGEKILTNLSAEIEKLRAEAKASNDHMLQYKSIAQVNDEALKQMESAYTNLKTEADEVRRSLEAELHSLRERVNELESECKLKTEELISATAGKEEALAGAFSEIASLKDDYSVKMSQIVVMESQISVLKEDLEKEHERWRTAQANYERQVILQSETIQELTKTSQALASSQEETSGLRKMANELKTENVDLKSKLETEKLALQVYESGLDKKYHEVNELNKILHSRLEALHIKVAEKERSGSSSSHTSTDDDNGMQNVVNYLRRSKEIAETEISLLKQEKHRLQSQLESALRSAESAQSSLHSERAKTRDSCYTDEEFKRIQLQVREVTLLRESNVQLREENRHNFEECQKLREASRNLETVLRNRESEVEAYGKEIEVYKMERASLEKRNDELVEKLKDFDVHDYNRLKEYYQQMQVSVREKDAQLEDMQKLLSEKQDAVSQLECEIARNKAELSEKETKINDLLQAEASLKSEVEKLKQIEASLKSEAEKSRRINLTLKRKSDQLAKQNEILNKQLDEAKQGKGNSVDPSVEQAMREKEKEKDTRIQTLEKALERHREDLKREKEDLKREKEERLKEKEEHLKEKEKSKKIRKTIGDSSVMVTQQKNKLTDDLKQHKIALNALQDEVERIKNSMGGNPQSETTPNYASTLLDDFASAYFNAVENFEHMAQPILNELESSTSTDAPSTDNSNTPSAAGPAPTDRRLVPTKANVRTGRKLLRPNIAKPKEQQQLQPDVEMSEPDESNTVSESQGNVTVPTVLTAPAPSLVRKRPLDSDLQEENLSREETGTEVAIPVLKKSKNLDMVQEGTSDEASVAAAAGPGKLPEVAGTEEFPSDVGIEESGDAENDELEIVGEQVDEPKVDEPDLVSDVVGEVADEKSGKSNDQIDQENQPVTTESLSEREDGEMEADFADNDEDENEIQPELSVEPENTISALEAGEINPSPSREEEKNEGDENDDVADPVNPGPTTTTNTITTNVDVVAPELDEPTPTPDPVIDNKPVSPVNTVSSTTTTINLQERARQRALERQRGMGGRTRGRVARGQGVRGGRPPARGQSPG